MRSIKNILVTTAILGVIFNVVFWGMEKNSAFSSRNISSENLAVIMLIDISGSMRRTDPQRLRQTAAGVFIDLLSPDDSLGIVIFDDEVEVVVPLEAVQTYDNKNQIKEILYPKLDPRGFTDYVGALETVFKHLEEFHDKKSRPVVVFLTDGDPNPYSGSRDDPSFMEGYMEELWDLVRQYTRERYPIYSIGFGTEIQPGVLEKISQETRGGYYILESSDELLVTFFELLGELKNRQTIVKDTLAPRTKKDFTFLVDEFTRQINFVAASQDQDKDLILLNPGGEKVESGQIPGVIISEEQGSTLVVLHQLDARYHGEWTLSVTGAGTVQLLGDRDLYLQLMLQEPLPYSQQPVNEPLELKLMLFRDAVFQDIELRAEVHLSGPGIERPVVIPLEETLEDTFTGRFDRIVRPGTYNLQVRLLQEDELISTLSSNFYAKHIPTLTTDFFADREYISGQEFIVTASLQAGGNRLQAGRELSVDEFQFLILYEDGTIATYPLLDSGDFIEHGDLRARDGIWSNRLNLEPGKAEVILTASGTYRETDFLLERRLGELEVFEAGSLSFRILGEHWGVPGRTVNLPLEINSNSDLGERITVSVSGDAGRMTAQSAVLEPGETITLGLAISFSSDLEPGKYQVLLDFASERESTLLQPGNLIAAVELLTPRAAFMRSYMNTALWVMLAVILFTVLFSAGILVGLFLYKINVSPNTRLKGSLFYRRIGASKDEAWQEIKFKGLHDKAVITFNPENRQADFHIGGSEFDYDIEIKTLWPNRGPRFIQGLRSFKKKDFQSKTMLRCTPPGVIEYEGRISIEKEIFHEDRFQSGDFSFHFVNPFGRWEPEKDGGSDILGGKFFNIGHENSSDL